MTYFFADDRWSEYLLTEHGQRMMRRYWSIWSSGKDCPMQNPHGILPCVLVVGLEHNVPLVLSLRCLSDM
jgi:hypothetical protein